MADLDDIRQTFATGRYRYTLHAVKQTTVRRISRREIEQAIAEGEVIESYPHDKYGPSCLIFGMTAEGRPLHVQCTQPPEAKVITAYEPDPNKWVGYRERREAKDE